MQPPAANWHQVKRKGLSSLCQANGTKHELQERQAAQQVQQGRAHLKRRNDCLFTNILLKVCKVPSTALGNRHISMITRTKKNDKTIPFWCGAWKCSLSARALRSYTYNFSYCPPLYAHEHRRSYTNSCKTHKPNTQTEAASMRCHRHNRDNTRCTMGGRTEQEETTRIQSWSTQTTRVAQKVEPNWQTCVQEMATTQDKIEHTN